MPEQFKLSANQTWNGKAVETKIQPVQPSNNNTPDNNAGSNSNPNMPAGNPTTKPVATTEQPVVTKQDEKTIPSKEAIALREMLTGQTSVPEDKSTKVVAPLIKSQGSTTEPKIVVSQEEKIVQIQPAKTEAVQPTADNGVKVATPTKKD